MAHRPDVISRNRSDAVQFDIRIPRWVRAGDHTPAVAIPMFDQGVPDVERRAAGMRGEAHGPHVFSGDYRHRVELIPVRAGAHIRAGNDSPGSVDGGRWARGG